jgi:hypothetical protein
MRKSLSVTLERADYDNSYRMMLHLSDISYDPVIARVAYLITRRKRQQQHRSYLCTFPFYLPNATPLRMSDRTWIFQTTINTNLRINMADIMGLRQQILGKIVAL